MVVAYGLILPVPVLEAVPLGCFNLHASLLPRWRGAAPINRAIMAGDAETGVMVMRMAEGLDTGPIAMAERVPIGADMTAGDLHDALARLGADLMVRALGALERGTLATDAAAGRGRDLRGQDRQERDAHRLGEALEGRARPLPRTFAVSRRLVRACAGQRASRCCAPRAATVLARPAPCSTIASRSRAATARCGCSRSSAPASSRCRRRSFCAAPRSRPERDCREHPSANEAMTRRRSGRILIAAFSGSRRSRSGRANARATAISFSRSRPMTARCAATWPFRDCAWKTPTARTSRRPRAGRGRARPAAARDRQRADPRGASPVVEQGESLVFVLGDPAYYTPLRLQPRCRAAVRVPTMRARISWRCGLTKARRSPARSAILRRSRTWADHAPLQAHHRI